MTDQTTNNKRVASGAGAALLGRLGALIEAVSFIAFAWFYGAETYGLFLTLWAYVKVTTAIADGAMTTALQRFIPQASDERVDQITGFALKASFSVGIIIATLVTIFAAHLAPYINAADKDQIHLISIIKVYAWVLPFWTLVEVSTASIRARRTFGPEIKVRVFYEQFLRLVIGIGLAFAEYLSYGLFIAHLVSVIIAGMFGLNLVRKHYNLRAVLSAKVFSKDNLSLISYGIHVMPANLIKKFFSELPVMILNQMIPGAAGAAAAGYYGIARKFASVLQVIRLTFEYVMAPLASEKKGTKDTSALQDMYQFATRLSLTFALPLCAFLMIAQNDMLATMPQEFKAASIAIFILCIGRAVEAASGPSSAIIEMIGHKSLPLFNSMAGIITLGGLSYYLIPSDGVGGAALAATTGLNVTAWLALIEGRVIYKLKPYSAEIIRPLALSVVLSASSFYGLSQITFLTSPPYGIIASLVILLLSFALILRYGLSDADALALGKMGRLFKRK